MVNRFSTVPDDEFHFFFFSEQNVVELPPLRFTKESSKSGPLLMEAVVIDITPEYFSSAEDDLRTEADIEDVSMVEELQHVKTQLVAEGPAYENIEYSLTEKGFKNLQEHQHKTSNKSSENSEKDSFKSFSDNKNNDATMTDVSFSSAKESNQMVKDNKRKLKDENTSGKRKKSRSRSTSKEKHLRQERKCSDNDSAAIVTQKKTSKSNTPELPDEIRKNKKKRKNVTEVNDEKKMTDNEREDGSIGESTSSQERKLSSSEEKQMKKKRSKSKSMEKDDESIPKPPARKKKLSKTISPPDSKLEETSGRGTESNNASDNVINTTDHVSDKRVEASTREQIQKQSSDSLESAKESDSNIETEMESLKKNEKKSRSRSLSTETSSQRRKSNKKQNEKSFEENNEKQSENNNLEACKSDVKTKLPLILYKNVTKSLREIDEDLKKLENQIQTKCLSNVTSVSFEKFTLSMETFKKCFETIGENLKTDTETQSNVQILQLIDRPLQDLKTGLKLLDEKKTDTDVGDILEIFRLVLNHLKNQTAEIKEVENRQSMTDEFLKISKPLESIINSTDSLKLELSQKLQKGDKSKLSIELLRILVQPVQALKSTVELLEVNADKDGGGISTGGLVEPIQNLNSTYSIIEQHADQNAGEQSISKKIIKILSPSINGINETIKSSTDILDKKNFQILSEQVVKIHKELAKMVQEMFFSPSKSKSPVNRDSLPVLIHLSECISQILNNLTEAETETVAQTTILKREIFEPILVPLKGLQTTIDQFQQFTDDEEMYSEIITEHLRTLDRYLMNVECKLDALPPRKKGEINNENLKQIINEIRKEISLIFRFVEFGGESSAEVWNSLVTPLQKLNANLTVKKSIKKPPLHASKSGSSLGRSLEVIRQTSEEQSKIEVSQTEEPKMSLTVLRPLEKPLQDLEEGFGILMQHILERERLTDEEKPLMEQELQKLLEILSVSFETFQEKWLGVQNESPSNVSIQETNILLQLINELNNGANAIQSQMIEYEGISNKAKEVINENIHSNLKNLKTSISEVENVVRQESLETIGEMKKFKSTVDAVKNEMKILMKESTADSGETKVLNIISEKLNNLSENIKTFKIATTETDPDQILDDVIKKVILNFEEEIMNVSHNVKNDVKEGDGKVEKILECAEELAITLVNKNENLKIETLNFVTSAFDNFSKQIKDLVKSPEESKEVVTSTPPQIEEKTIDNVELDLPKKEESSSGGIKDDSVLEPKKLVRSSDEIISSDDKEENDKTQLMAPDRKVQEPPQADTLKEIINLIKINLDKVDLISNLETKTLKDSLKSLQAVMNTIVLSSDVEESAIIILENLVQPLKNLSEGLQTINNSSSTSSEMLNPLVDAGKKLLRIQEEIKGQINQIEKPCVVEKLLNPLENLQLGLSHILNYSNESMVSKPETMGKLENLKDLILKNIELISEIETFTKEDKIDLISPLQMIRENILNVENVENVVVEIVNNLINPLKEVEKNLTDVKSDTLEGGQILEPIMKIQILKDDEKTTGNEPHVVLLLLLYVRLIILIMFSLFKNFSLIIN